MKLKKLFERSAVFLWFSMLAFALAAEPVTPEMAAKAAGAWLRENPGAGQSDEVASLCPRAERSADGEVLWYEVMTRAKRCIVTSADTSVDPIVSVVENWTGPLPDDHPLRALLENDISHRMKAIRAVSQQPKRLLAAARPRTSPETRWRRLTSDRSPLMAAQTYDPDFVISYIPEWREHRLDHWNQRWHIANGVTNICYSLFTPQNAPCGCVATAGSCLLQYFNLVRPPDPQTVHACKYDGASFPVQTSGIAPDWTVLPLTWKENQTLTTAQLETIGHVTYDMGACCEMQWTASSAGAYGETLARALAYEYGLASARRVPQQYVSSPEGYARHIYAQNRAGAPVSLSIRSSARSTGHSILSVGYAEDRDGSSYVRLFMGWGGSSDAWYALPYAGRDYDAITGVITQMGEDEDVVAICGRIRNASGVPVAYAQVACDGEKTFRADRNGFWAGRVCGNRTHRLVCGSGERLIELGDDDQLDIDFFVDDETAEASHNEADAELRTLLDELGEPQAKVAAVSYGGPLEIVSEVELCASVELDTGKSGLIREGVTWKIVAGTSAILDGRRIRPFGAAGDVVLMGEVELCGCQYAFFQKVATGNGVTVVGLDEIEGPDRFDLADAPLSAFSARARLSDGTLARVPLNWSVVQPDGTRAAISRFGLLSLASYDFAGEMEIEVRAEIGGIVRSKKVTVVSPGGIDKICGLFDRNVCWRGGVVCFKLLGARQTRHGESSSVGQDSDEVDYEWTLYKNTSDWALLEKWEAERYGTGAQIEIPADLPENITSVRIALSVIPRNRRHQLGGSFGYGVFNLLKEPPERFDGLTLSDEQMGTHYFPDYLSGHPFVALPDLCKTGYLTQWRDETSAIVKTSNYVRPGGSTLTSSFSPISYRVRYYANATNGTGSMSLQSFSYDKPGALAKCQFKRPLWLFAGWGTEADGPIVYADGEEVVNLACVNGTIVNLYAQWDRVPLESGRIIAPDKIVGEAQLSAQLTFVDGTTLGSFDRAEWFVVAGDALTVTPDGVARTVPGRAGRVTVAVDLDVMGKTYRLSDELVSIAPDQIADLQIEGDSVWVPNAAKESVDYRVTGIVDGAKVVFGSAEWNVSWASTDGKAFSSYYTFSAGGTLTMKGSGYAGCGTISATVGPFLLVLPFQTYAFKTSFSWTSYPSSQVLFPGAQIKMNDLFTLKRSDGTIGFSGGYAGVDVVSFRFGQTTQAQEGENLFDELSMPKLEGDVLTVPEGAVCSTTNGLVYLLFKACPRGATSPSLSKSIKFQWVAEKPDVVSVTFDSQGGVVMGRGEEGSAVYLVGKTYGTLPTPKKAGHTFSGWYPSVTGGKKVSTSSKVDATRVRLFARWKASSPSYEIVFHANGGVGEDVTQTFAAEDLAEGRLPSCPFWREGWSFDGWATKQALSSSATRYADCAPLGELSISSSLHLYAVWALRTRDYVLLPSQDMAVPVRWIENRSVLEKAGRNPVKALQGPAANGRSVWECYVANLDPDDPSDDLRLAIDISDGEPKISYAHKEGCEYVEEGRPSLDSGEWRPRQSGDRFFRVSVRRLSAAPKGLSRAANTLK